MTTDYVVIVRGKYLQMVVAYSIHKEEPGRVTEHFERFNKDFNEVCGVFKEVTQLVYKPGQEVEIPKLVAPVKPIPREPKPQQHQLNQLQTLSRQEQAALEEFLGRHQLQELLQIFTREGVTLTDVLEMTEDNMKEVGITKYALRRRLLGAVMEEKGDIPVEQPHVDKELRQTGGQVQTVSAVAEDLHSKCRLEEAQAGSSR